MAVWLSGYLARWLYGFVATHSLWSRLVAVQSVPVKAAASNWIHRVNHLSR